MRSAVGHALTAISKIRTPIVEQTGLFVRSIGEETDVVGKEMYTFLRFKRFFEFESAS